ncbi:hypothetical protein Sta7437_2852 [Stanieria cyanosphaera PCC 7437]|uniref:DUF2157 domain-containing protein n=1 Tax=Stanieria cyanosphaera (strain ATCC 29371 / PCC 7437) TaxID=111780 RepID=K9XXI1_STAC7|nr:hypothetical protein [Stanieria cyanosphaera]AFZ36372.1 hypothetical protein Sta7437_2852 [Stanieria cyanosphaera PCC 7437]
MSNDSDRFIKLEIYTKASQTELLIGLDNWLRLGLIKESQVKNLCRNYLTCPLPEIEIVKVPYQVEETSSPQPVQTATIDPISIVKTSSKPNLVEQIWQAFLDELSIRWLLFLGIFLVVLSSGVLAATQWHNFPTVGQYLILLTYTLSFWLVGFWLGKQANLSLTSQSLKSIAILLVPINFWGINSFSLGNNFGDWLVIAIAFLSLTGITYWQYNQKPKYIRFSFVPIFLLLSYFHLGWHIFNFPVLAAYFGIIAIASSTYYLSKKYHYQLKNLLLLLATWFLLIFRTLLIQTSVTSLGLAISICGWLLAVIYLERSQTYSTEQETSTDYQSINNHKIINQSLETVGLILLFIGGIVAGIVWFAQVQLYPWQAIAVCGLALHLFQVRLQTYWQKLDLLVIFFIGLKTLFLIKELIPIQFRANFISLSETITKVDFLPESIYSITLFPYLILFVGIANWLYRQEKPQLALFGEWLSLGFGVVLTLLSWYNPVWRSLNLLLSTFTLGYVAATRQPLRIRLIYFTHLLALVTVVSVINCFSSPPRREIWGIIFLLLMLAEWLVYLRRFSVKNFRYQKIWYRSSWYFGLLLAGISYVCFLPQAHPVNTSIISSYSLTWLLTPLMLTIIAKSSRRKPRQLAALLSCFTLLLAQLLTMWQPDTRSISLAITTGLLFTNTFYLPYKIILIYLTHSLGLITVFSFIDWVGSPLGQQIWGIILLFSGVTEWLIYLYQITSNNLTFNLLPIGGRRQEVLESKTWHRSSWYLGLLLTGISYVCLFYFSNPYWRLIWLLTPLMLTVIVRFSRWKQRTLTAACSSLSLILVQFLTFNNSETRLISLVVAIGLMFINSFYFRETNIAIIHLGFGLILISSLLWEKLSFSNWLVTGAIIIVILYLIREFLLYTSKNFYANERKVLKTKHRKLKNKYAQAADSWSKALIAVELIILTLFYLNFAFSDLTYQQIGINWQYLLSSILISGAIWFRYHQQPTPKILYAFAWTIELSVFSLIILVGGNEIALAAANIILAFLSLWLINWLARLIATTNNHSPLQTIRYNTFNLNWHNLHHLSIIYLVLGILWRLPYFTATTGLITLGAALTGIGIGSYPGRENKTISYLSLAGITLAIYELAIYQMTQSAGGSIADALTILAFVAGVIAIFYRILAFWCREQQFLFNFSLNQIIIAAHVHWAIASILKIIAAGIAIETVTPRLTLLSIGISFCLGAYAIIQGREERAQGSREAQRQEKKYLSTINDWWVYVGLVEIAATIVYSRLIITKLSIFDPWRAIITCIIALAIYQIPWQNFGWRSTPWRRTALVIPALMALVTAENISYLSLLATAAFYLRIAYHQRNVRWSYLSLGLIDWGIIRYSWRNNGEPIWFALVIGLSFLYIAQFDPQLQTRKQLRHYFRSFGSSLICIVALILYQKTGIIPSAIALVFILAGLGLRIRAFLYIGTITFILTIIYQLIILIFTYSFLKWIVGLITGIVAIAIAANFERKSTQITNKLQDYLAQLQQWQ